MYYSFDLQFLSLTNYEVSSQKCFSSRPTQLYFPAERIEPCNYSVKYAGFRRITEQVGSSGNNLDLYSEVAEFEFRPVHRLS
jgi:hypothetical protein